MDSCYCLQLWDVPFFRTIFTHADRHTYVDPDYAYTDEEASVVAQHKQYYIDYIAFLREQRAHHAQAMWVIVLSTQL